MPYSKLNPDRIIDTANMLERRISERFPGSGLQSVAVELTKAGMRAKQRAQKLEAANWWLRLLTLAGIIAFGVLFVSLFRFLNFDRLESGAFDIVQGVEASVNTVVLAGIGLITLVGLEQRYKRQSVLKGLHELRALIHVIDMHQLTKDPVILSSGFKPTKSSPARTLSPADLSRYLDYCSEMLSLTGKFAALFAQAMEDMEVANAVNDVEALGANLSRKIWQKIMLINEMPVVKPARPKAKPAAGRKPKNA